ncbi:hypothetical protein GF325_16815 [Candidatus Bathyarchaeota archaeon]|nr:hypothetical protein [Candidatus Bathyarchaeota archaeon]
MRPLDLLNLNMNGEIQIHIKRNKRYVGKLGGFDEHLNLVLKETKGEFIDEDETEDNEQDEEEGEEMEDIGSIILRGDNIIYLKITNPVFTRPRRESRGRPNQRDSRYRKRETGYSGGSRRR